MYYVNCEICNFRCGDICYHEWHRIIFAKEVQKKFEPLTKNEKDELLFFLRRERNHFKDIQTVTCEDGHFDLFDPIRERRYLLRGTLPGRNVKQDELDRIELLNDSDDKNISSTGLPFLTMGLFVMP